MSNIFNMVSEETFSEKMDTQNQFLAALVSAQGGSLKPTAWSDVQAIVRAGLAPRVFAIGDQLVCNKSGVQLVWDIIGIDHDTPADPQFTHSLTLQLHDCYKDTVQFDREEAFYYCEAELPAGTYYITVGANWGTYCKLNETYMFTLTKPVPAGGQLVGFYRMPDTAPSTWKVQSYASATSTTVIEEVTVTAGSSGTSLGTLLPAGDFANNRNSLHRLAYGSNNYGESAMRQFLNSKGAAGTFWTPQTKFDRPPTWLATLPGWMNGMDEDFLAVLGKTHIVVSRNTVCDGGGSDEFDDTFFLLSRREAYTGNEVASVIEGEPYPYYSDYSDLSAAGTGNDTNRIKYRNGSAQYWWLRSPYAGNGSIVRSVGPAGLLSFSSADGSCGVAPACNII